MTNPGGWLARKLIVGILFFMGRRFGFQPNDFEVRLKNRTYDEAGRRAATTFKWGGPFRLIRESVMS